VGYAGGATPNPTYHRLGDHTETVEIDFDPAVISYEHLLDIFWRSHHPGQPAWSKQYRAVVFYHGDRQKTLALKTRDQAAARLHSPVATAILPAGPFTLAEGYHQKYYLRQRPDLLAEFETIYPSPEALAGSTAAARVNGYLAGYGAPGELQAELDGLGLTPDSRRKLMNIMTAATRRSGPGCPVPQKPGL
jgi:peptide-methionine (S)-S-oxide reductase